jgi:hypothetical protein
MASTTLLQRQLQSHRAGSSTSISKQECQNWKTISKIIFSPSSAACASPRPSTMSKFHQSTTLPYAKMPICVTVHNEVAMVLRSEARISLPCSHWFTTRMEGRSLGFGRQQRRPTCKAFATAFSSSNSAPPLASFGSATCKISPPSCARHTMSSNTTSSGSIETCLANGLLPDTTSSTKIPKANR